MDAAWVAVIGTLGGVIAGGGTNVVLERMRWSRDERAALRQAEAEAVARRRDTCIEYAALSDELQSRLWSFVDYRLADPSGWRTDEYVQKQQDLLETAIGKHDRLFNELLILGMGSFVNAAYELHSVVGKAVDAAYGDPPEHLPGNALGDKTNAFLLAVASDPVLGHQVDAADTALTRTAVERSRSRRQRRQIG